MTRITKAIPRAGVPVEERRAMRDERAGRYPDIPILESGALAAGPDDPTDEDLWADPVNLAYPIAYAGQTIPDRIRAANARARFQQSGGRYPNDTTRRAVYTRIVQGVIDAGTAAPSYDPNNRFDALLPDDVVSQITGRRAQRGTGMNKFDAALSGFKKSMGGYDASPSLDEIVHELHELVDLLYKLGHERAAQLLAMTKSVLHEAGVGDPASLGLVVDDRSADPNYSPVSTIAVPADRVGADAIATMTVEQALDLPPNPDPNPNSPALEPTPGPRVPTALPQTDGAIVMPPPSIASATGREVDGVAKSVKSFSEFIIRNG